MAGTGRLVWAALAVAVGFFPAIGRGETVLLASSRNGWIEFVDLNTLQVKGRLFTGSMTESVVAGTDGRTLFVTKPRASEPEGCCALYAFDLKERISKELLWPSGAAVVLPGANEIVTQRGNVGIEVFNAHTLLRMPTLKAPGIYGLHPSPDGRWLFGTNTFGSTLDIFDMQRSVLLRSIPVPSKGTLSGAWLGSCFYLYAQDRTRRQLWKVSIHQTELDEGSTVQLPGVSDSDVAFGSAVGMNGHLLLYDRFGSKLDRRSRATTALAGGIYEVDPASGSVISSLVPDLHFSVIKADASGEKIFGIDVASESWEAVRLVKVDRQSGHVDAARELAPDVWNINLAEIASGLIPQNCASSFVGLSYPLCALQYFKTFELSNGRSP